MSQALAQALLDEHLVTQANLDEAQRRQVVYGGSLDTTLLEMGVIDEPRLVQALCNAYRLPPAERSEIDSVPTHIPRIFPLVFAETYHMVPFRLVGTNLGVLVNGPPDPQLFERIRERLQLHAAPTVTIEARLHYAMHRLYGVELLPRFQNLLTKLDGTAPAPLYDAPRGEQMLSWGLASSHVRPSRARGETRRGQPDVAGLLARLDSATDRDSIVEVLLEIALGTFEFAALFVVQGERINGWRSTDPELTQRVARVSMPVELPSVFQTIYATRGHYLGPVHNNSANAKLLADLGRAAPRTAFVAPISVGGRLAAILWADNGQRGIPSRRVSGILLLTHRVGACLENLIRRRKSGPPPTPRTASPSARAPVHAQTHAPAPELEIIEIDDVELVHEPALPQAAMAPLSSATPPLTPEDQQESWEEVRFEPGDGNFKQDGSAAAATADFERGLAAAVEIEIDVEALDADDGYVPFGDVLDAPEEAVGDWEDVLVDASGDPAAGTRAAPASTEAAPPAVTWDHVIAEARAAPTLSTTGANVTVAGTVVSERELLLDGLDALDLETRSALIPKVLALGSDIDDLLRERFPGRLVVDPFATESPLPAFWDCSGLLAVVAARGAQSAPVVLPHLDSRDPVQRFFAIYYLLSVSYPEALEALARRLYDSEPRNRYLAADALRGYVQHPSYARILQSLRDQLKVPVYETQVNTVQVLGQLRDPRAVPSLIPLVVSTQPELSSATTSALAVICAQAFGPDVTRWAEWWQRSYNKPREAWLVASLRHPSLAVQSIAFAELQLLTGYAGEFDPAASADAKEPIIAVWEGWIDQLTRSRRPGAGAAATA